MAENDTRVREKTYVDCSKGSVFFMMFQDYWLYQKKYLKQIELNNLNKESLVSDGNALIKKYSDYISYISNLVKSFKNLCQNPPEISLLNTDKNSKFFQLFGDFWGYQKKYLNGDKDNLRTDPYWEKLIDEGTRIANKYKEFNGFAESIILDFINETERKYRIEIIKKTA